MSEFRLRRDGLAWSDVDHETVILELGTSTYFTVRGSGTQLLKNLLDGTTVDELVESLTTHYEVDAATARTDVERFLADLRVHSLLEPPPEER